MHGHGLWKSYFAYEKFWKGLHFNDEILELVLLEPLCSCISLSSTIFGAKFMIFHLSDLSYLYISIPFLAHVVRLFYFNRTVYTETTEGDAIFSC